MFDKFNILNQNSNLFNQDKEVYDAIIAEQNRQEEGIELIASENIVSKAVLEAMGSILTNKYAEGYPHHRYYGGCEYWQRWKCDMKRLYELLNEMNLIPNEDK